MISNYNNFFIFLILVSILACCKQKNALKQDELVLIEELSNLNKIAVDENSKDTSPERQKSNVLEESRNVNPQNPPIVLNVIQAREDVRNINLKDLYSGVKYIPIHFQEPVDSIWNLNDEFDFIITPNSIIASHFSYGITQFDLQGQAVNQIVKNEFYYTFYPTNNFVAISSEDRKQFVGAKGSIHAIGDQVYYQHFDVPNQEGWLMEYDASPGTLSASLKSDVLEDDKGHFIGKKLFPFPVNESQGLVTNLGARNLFPVNEDTWASFGSKMNSSRTGSFLSVTNLSADTLCNFIDHDPIRNFTGSIYRGIDDGSQYYFQGIQHIRQPFNDTIYAISEPNQLSPRYIIDFGNKGIKSSMEGIDPEFNLDNKFILADFIETNDYIFIIYTQNNTSPNSARKGTLLYNGCIYDKDEDELYHIYIDEKPHMTPDSSWPKSPISYIRNDYDFGPAFWPKAITQEGLPFMWFKVYSLKQSLKNISWKNNTSLKNSILRMQDTDYLLMLPY